ncbi:ABC transporter permease [Aliikangiella coralliicola]|uniref:FtsX-like permease family protein n=1 Tax=Aliikangiella coralliicola TaxID=2592383 RepID=A0A545U6J8_9GAMM|nr:FtsX-like permease family protein [Aliikangiella coralliicola]TQV85033.1 FtsX-like permease family protein [Aliikangiella coralliicola]
MLEIKPILSALLRHKSSTLLIVLQIALTLAVVVNAVYIISERLSLIDSKSGLPESEIFTLGMNAFGENPDLKYDIQADQELIRNMPGVVDAVVINATPLGRGGDNSSVAGTKEDYDNGNNVNVAFYRGDSHMLNSFGINLISGRNFTEEEIIYNRGYVDPKVAIITETVAKRLYPDGNALGSKIYFNNYEVTIIGIVDYAVSPWVHHPNHDMAIFNPLVHLDAFHRVLVRTEKGALKEVMGQIEEKLLERNPDRVVFAARTMAENRELSYQGDVAMSKILTVVIALLVTITALGIVGIVSFNISQRTKQIGTRRALGASKADIQRYFVTETIILTTLGLVIGTILAVTFNMHLVDSYQLPPIQWHYIPVGMITMLVTGILAVWVPAKRASSVSPAVATQSI